MTFIKHGLIVVLVLFVAGCLAFWALVLSGRVDVSADGDHWALTHTDEELWPIVALVLEFPDLSGEDYEQLLAAARAAGVEHTHDHDHAHEHRPDHGHQEHHEHHQSPHHGERDHEDHDH